MEVPETLKYTRTRQWVRLDGEKAHVGITDYAQETLGDIVFVELLEIGKEVRIDEDLSIIGSDKAAEPICSPISGMIVEVNETINKSPEILNSDPYSTSLFTVQIEAIDEIGKLLSCHAICRAPVASRNNLPQRLAYLI